MFDFHVSGIIRLCIKRAVTFLLSDWKVLECRIAVIFAALEVAHWNIEPTSITRCEYCWQFIMAVFVEGSEVLNKVIFSLEAMLALVGSAFRARIHGEMFLSALDVAL